MTVSADADTFVSLLCILGLLASLTSTIDIDAFLSKIKQPTGIIIGLFCQYFLMPFTSFIVAYTFELHPSAGIALVIVGTCPGGAMSNFWCFLFNADLPLSIAMTTCSSVFSFAFIAMNSAIYIPVLSKDTNIDIDWLSLILSVSAVLVGILIGIFIAYKGNASVIKFMGFLGVITMITILVWALVNTGNSNAPLRDTPALIWLAVIVTNIVSLIVSFFVAMCCKLKRQSVVAVAIESSNQNSALAIAIILLSLEEGYDRDLAVNVPVVYLLMNILFVFLFGLTLRRTGWLQIDYDDSSMTFGKIVEQWRKNKKTSDVKMSMSKDHRNEQVDDENEDPEVVWSDNNAVQ